MYEYSSPDWAWSAVLSGIISTFINAYPNKRLIGYTYLEQIKGLMPSFLLSAFIGVIVYLVGLLPLNIINVKVILQIITGATVYTALAWQFKVSSYSYLVGLVTRLKSSAHSK